MSFVLKNGLYVEKAATDMMVAFDSEQAMVDGWMRPFFWRRRNTDQLSGIYRQQSIDDQLRIYDVALAPGVRDSLPESSFELDADIFFKNGAFGIETVIDYVENAAADPVINYASRQTQDAIFKFFNSIESIAVGTLRNPAILTSSIALSNAQRFDNYASTQSNPIAALVAAKMQIEQDTGKTMNRVGIDSLVWEHGFKLNPYALARCPVQVAPQIMGAGATLTKELLEKILEIPEGSIQIYKKRYNPSRKGEPSNRRRSHLGSDIVCAYVEDPNQSSVGFGHETSFTGLSELPSDYPFAVLTYEDPKSGLYGSQRARVVSLMGWTVTRQQSAVKITNTVDLTDLTKYGYQGFPVLD